MNLIIKIILLINIIGLTILSFVKTMNGEINTEYIIAIILNCTALLLFQIDDYKDEIIKHIK